MDNVVIRDLDFASASDKLWEGEGALMFKDPTGATRAATIAVSIYAVVAPGAALLRWSMPPDPIEGGPADLVTVLAWLMLLVCAILVGRWIYRTNANAHSLSPAMSITPGWAVGWFFVPFANLYKPYQGVQETWAASHEAAGRYESIETPLLGWWWGLWIAFNFGSNISGRFADAAGAGSGALLFDLLVWALNVPLSIVLIVLMRRLSSTQLAAQHGGIFA